MQQRLGLAVRVALKKDNCIKQVYAHPQDEEWSLNMKRGLVNLFQISPRQDDRDREFVTQIEVRSWLKCNKLQYWFDVNIHLATAVHYNSSPASLKNFFY